MSQTSMRVADPLSVVGARAPILLAVIANERSGRTTSSLEFDVAGVGETVVLVHAGVADRRMWDPQWAALAATYRVVRYDARGFGETSEPRGPWSHWQDLLEVLDALGIHRAHLVGCSMGSGTAVELALADPGRVASLVLAAPGGALYEEPPEALRRVWRVEAEALDRGDLDAAVEVNLRVWVDGPARSPEQVDPGVRAHVEAMQRRAFELPEWDEDAAPEGNLEPPAAERFAELELPVLTLVGELDQPASIALAERLATEIHGCRLERWPDVAHLPSLERPDAFTALVFAWLAEVVGT